MNSVTVVLVDFDALSRSIDEQVVQRMIFACRMSKKALLPRNLNYNFARVTRQSHLVTIHLSSVTAAKSKEREVAQFSFAPPPDFSRASCTL